MIIHTTLALLFIARILFLPGEPLNYRLYAFCVFISITCSRIHFAQGCAAAFQSFLPITTNTNVTAPRMPSNYCTPMEREDIALHHNKTAVENRGFNALLIKVRVETKTPNLPCAAPGEASVWGRRGTAPRFRVTETRAVRQLREKQANNLSKQHNK